MREKQELRAALAARRNAMDKAVHESLSRELVSRLEAWLGRKKAHQLFLFQPLKNEPDIAPMAGRLGIKLTLGLPVICGESMDFFAWRPGDELARGPFGIHQPAALTSPLKADAETIILVPALGFSRDGHRLGFGKGYYDRYLARIPAALCVGVCFETFVFDTLPHESFDVPVSWLATELGVETVVRKGQN